MIILLALRINRKKRSKNLKQSWALITKIDILWGSLFGWVRGRVNRIWYCMLKGASPLVIFQFQSLQTLPLDFFLWYPQRCRRIEKFISSSTKKLESRRKYQMLNYLLSRSSLRLFSIKSHEQKSKDLINILLFRSKIFAIIDINMS